MTAIRALIVDDDSTARARVRALLAEAPDVAVVGECADGEFAVAALGETAVDVVFLDVDMPRLDGFGVVARVGVAAMPAIIFTTAYAEYAVRAFEAYAIDFLLKPYETTRFHQALDRARAEVRRRASDPTADPRVEALLDHVQATGRVYPRTIAVKVGARFQVVSLATIDHVEADGNVAHLFHGTTSHVVARSLATLEAEILDPAVFVRVHKSAMVNVTLIQAIEPVGHGDLSLLLTTGARVACSRRYRDRLEARIRLTT